MRDQFLQHLRSELSVLDVEGEIRLVNGPDVDLRRQIVLDYGFRRVFDGLELAFHYSWRESAVSVYVNLVHVVLSVAQQRQFFARFPVLG